MASKLAEDPRIDPRLKAVFGSLGVLTATGDVASREDLLAAANSESGKKQAAAMAAMQCPYRHRLPVQLRSP